MNAPTAARPGRGLVEAGDPREKELAAFLDALRKTGAATSAQRIHEACLFLRGNGARSLTATVVGDYCQQKFGGPQVQSIRNKPDTLLQLVKLHGELHRLQTGARKKKGPARDGPVIDDPGVAAYVMVLESRVKELERSNDRLAQAFKKLQPLQIGSAPSSSASPKAQSHPIRPDAVTDVEREAITKFLDVEQLRRNGFVLDERGRIMDGRQVIVESPVVRLLARLLEEKKAADHGAG